MKSFAFRVAAIASVVSLLGAPSAFAAGFFNNQLLNLFTTAATTINHTQSVSGLTSTTTNQFSVGPSNQSAVTNAVTTTSATSVINATTNNSVIVNMQ